MAVVMVVTDRGAGPVMFYDHCGERILHANQANYEWDQPHGLTPGTQIPVWFLHKGCSLEHEAAYLAQHPASSRSSMELIAFLPYVASNINLNWEEGLENSEFFDGSGDARFS